MSKIFLSYRRQDSAGVAGRIYDRLRAHFGDDAIFMDIDAIPFGLDFREHIARAVGQCGVLLAVIGPQWAGQAGAPRRIDDPRDFVRIEIESALERNLPVIPILIDRARMPGEADLPPSLAPLAYRNAIEVDQGRDFHPHVDRLIRGIERLLQQADLAAAAPPRQPEKPAAVIPAAREREPEQRRQREPVDAGRRPKPPAGLEPRPERSPGAPDPAPPPKPKPPGAGGSKSKVPAKPAGEARSESAPIPTQAGPLARGAAVANPLLGTPATRRRRPGLRVYLTVLPLLAVLGIVIYIVTDTGTVKITGTDPNMVVRIDGRETRIENLGEPITLRTGPHDLVVRRGNLVAATQTFQIQRGQETRLDVTYIPKPPKPNESPTRAAPSLKPEPASPHPMREFTNSIGMKLTLITVGTFQMGSPESDTEAETDEKPQHRVRITQPFYLGVTEVTRGQFRRFVDENGYQTEAEKDGKGGWGWNEDAKKFEQNPRYTWQNPGFEQTDEHPVVNVSWNDAVAFTEWLSRKEGNTYRLPTEAEWEYACRAGTTTRYSCGDDPEGLAAVGNIADGTAKAKYADWTTIAARDGYIYTAPVGRFQPNEFGLYDMHGNVWEWCSDGYAADYYKQSPVDDPPGAAGAAPRVIRGGSWDRIPRRCRSAYRLGVAPADRFSHVGFRLARVQSSR
jgi:formylglycine-generating enzyme required for sulfatase activity